MNLRRSLAATVLFLAFVGLVSAAAAATLHVRADGSGEYPTIRKAMMAAVSGDSVMLENGWYRGDDNHNIDFTGRQLTFLSASGDPTLCVIDCSVESPDEERGFHFQTGEDAGSVVDGIGIINGYAHGSYCNTIGAAILCQTGSSPTIRNCNFKFCDSSTGGAVGISYSSPVFYNCRFVQNVSTWTGGAVYVNGTSSAPQFIGCRFLQNTTGYDGGAAVVMSGNPGFIDCEFDGNAGSNFGGVIDVNAGHTTLRGCIIRNHVAAYQGGVFFTEPGSTLTIEGCTLSGNRGVWGGISYIRGQEIWRRCTLVGNGSEHASLIRPSEAHGAVRLDHCVIAFSSLGSAVSCGEAGTAVVQCSDIFANPQGDWSYCIADQYDGFSNVSLDPGFCNPEEGDFHLRPDSPLLEGNNPCGRMGAWGPGCESASAPDAPADVDQVQVRVTPNPTMSDSRIEWSGSELRPASIQVFDVSGRQVRSIRNLPPGLTAATWNGRGDAGNPLPSGIYLVRVRTVSGEEIGAARVLLTR